LAIKKLRIARGWNPTPSTKEIDTMGNQTSRLLEAVFTERSRLLTRRSMLKMGAAGALTLGVASALPMSRMTAFAQDIALTTDVDVLNYATPTWRRFAITKAPMSPR
jgi:hypothetical protein